jgi:hypothetical protein
MAILCARSNWWPAERKPNTHGGAAGLSTFQSSACDRPDHPAVLPAAGGIKPNYGD